MIIRRSSIFTPLRSLALLQYLAFPITAVLSNHRCLPMRLSPTIDPLALALQPLAWLQSLSPPRPTFRVQRGLPLLLLALVLVAQTSAVPIGRTTGRSTVFPRAPVKCTPGHRKCSPPHEESSLVSECDSKGDWQIDKICGPLGCHPDGENAACISDDSSLKEAVKLACGPPATHCKGNVLHTCKGKTDSVWEKSTCSKGCKKDTLRGRLPLADRSDAYCDQCSGEGESMSCATLSTPASTQYSCQGPQHGELNALFLHTCPLKDGRIQYCSQGACQLPDTSCDTTLPSMHLDRLRCSGPNLDELLYCYSPGFWFQRTKCPAGTWCMVYGGDRHGYACVNRPITLPLLP